MPPFAYNSSLIDPRVSPVRKLPQSAVPLLLSVGRIGIDAPANFATYSLDGGDTFSACVVPDPASGLYGAAYSPSLGYAILVASAGQVYQSFDGITWIAMAGNNLTAGNWTAGVVRNAADTLFVTVGAGGVAGSRAATSPDGANWTLRTTPNTAAGSSFGQRLLKADNGTLIAVGTLTGVTPFIASTDGGITWAYLAAPDGANNQDFTDFAIRSGTTYMQTAGSTNPGPGDTFYSSNLGAAWTECVRSAVNIPPNCNACAIDPVRGFFYMAHGTMGIWRVPCNDPNATLDQWTQVYAAGNVAPGCRGGYIEALDAVIFTDTTGNFRTHKSVSGGAWTTTVHGTLVGASHAKLDFLAFE